MAREGIEFAHQDREQAQRRGQPEFHRALIKGDHAERVRWLFAIQHGARILDREEISQISETLARIDQSLCRPDHVPGRQRMPVRPAQVLAQGEGPAQTVRRDKPALGKARPQ